MPLIMGKTLPKLLLLQLLFQYLLNWPLMQVTNIEKRKTQFLKQLKQTIS
jgi:hypothetical protein